MAVTRFTPQRYQLKKEAVTVVLNRHPWIFRDHLSTAVQAFQPGQWLALYDHRNVIVGYGIYESDGAIGIRVLRFGSQPPNKAYFQKLISRALDRRKELRTYTNAFRTIHGENDGLPGIVLDVYGDTGVLQTYAQSVDSLGRYVAGMLFSELGLKNLIWKYPTKRKRKHDNKFRILRGTLPQLKRITEGKMALFVDISSGQKSGAFLDLRGLRKYLNLENLRGKRVLNLFSYTGTLGLAAEIAGASYIRHVDVSRGALEFTKKHHAINAKKHEHICADVFSWLRRQTGGTYDCIIVDPPQMASLSSQVPTALKAYRQLYRNLRPLLASHPIVIACCCTSRITRSVFRRETDKNLSFLKRIRELGPEDDHPVSFPQGDYLKILIYKK
ncbi:MAG: class I SAM-dependent rRNA methyltransferase [Deltaproteobacteria bacterium]|nr:class I SAM-dependent rRNA methyltransferase [Deltaproteobacteria bacterium]